MSDPLTRRRRIENLRAALEVHGLKEERGAAVEHVTITPVLGQLGVADVIEVTEDGVRTYRGWVLTDDENDDG